MLKRPIVASKASGKLQDSRSHPIGSWLKSAKLIAPLIQGPSLGEILTLHTFHHKQGISQATQENRLSFHHGKRHFARTLKAVKQAFDRWGSLYRKQFKFKTTFHSFQEVYRNGIPKLTPMVRFPNRTEASSTPSGWQSGFISFGVKTPAIHSGDIDTALLERTKHRKIHLTFGLKCSIIRVSSWQTYSA